MTNFERWFVARVLRREVMQGPHHPERITGLYRMIRDAAEAEFAEDNAATLSEFLSERFELTQLWPFGKPDDENDCPRNELVVAVHTLASHYENALGAFGDDEGKLKAERDIVYAMNVASRHNYNGVGCRRGSNPPRKD